MAPKPKREQKPIALAAPVLSPKALRNVRECFERNWLSQGFFNEAFEREFAKQVGTTHALTCSNGTGALWLALKAIGIGQGDEVIVPTLTFSATAAAVVVAGGTPVFVDSREEDGNLSVEEVRKALTSKTKAIIAVDLYGLPPDYAALRKLARSRRVYLIEDAAEGLGGSYQGKPLGSLGDIGTFSFYANKIITTGEGGMCVTDSKKLFEAMHLYKNHGNKSSPAYFPDVVGFNMRMTNLQAAVGAAQMESLSSLLEARYKVFETYLDLLRHSAIRPLPFKKRKYAPWMFTVRVPNRLNREVMSVLSDRGIESRPGFSCLHLTPAFKRYVKKGQRFPIAERMSKELLNLPTHPGLKTADIKRVAEALKKSIA